MFEPNERIETERLNNHRHMDNGNHNYHMDYNMMGSRDIAGGGCNEMVEPDVDHSSLEAADCNNEVVADGDDDNGQHLHRPHQSHRCDAHDGVDDHCGGGGDDGVVGGENVTAPPVLYIFVPAIDPGQ